MTHKRWESCGFISLLIFTCISLFYQYGTREYSVLPLRDENHVYIQVDQNSEESPGNSVVKNLQVEDSLTSYSFRLGDKLPYPYAGIGINFYDTTAVSPDGLDLSSYDYVELEIAASVDMLILGFTSYVEGFTHMDSSMSWRVYESLLGVSDTFTTYTIDLRSFTTPSWWYNLNAVTKDRFPDKSHGNILSFIIENNHYEEFSQEFSKVKIRRITFVRDTLLTVILHISALLLICGAWVGRLFFRPSSTTPVIIPYQELEISSYEDEDLQKVETFIANNYTNQDLLVRDVSSSTGVTQAKIQTVLRKKFDMTFRQYLNKIRIHEAKRLLRETDRQVTDIAFRVGYRNVSHFNRIFKEKEGVSPNKYRKQQ
ncbi:helix-turn-helix domain-containing protein [Chitinivibrio alkaliphilus]|nr:helix-turn-helix transcriptional regulator [Chitinivibrio alkaliphilus]